MLQTIFIKTKRFLKEKLKNSSIDYDLFEIIANVDYSSVEYISDNKNMNRIDSFASKYLSFCKPDIYPIMDRMVKMAIGVSEDIKYKDFCMYLFEFKKAHFDCLRKQYSLKNIDKFLWLWGKEYFKKNGQ